MLATATKQSFLNKVRIQINIGYLVQCTHIHFTKELGRNVKIKGDNWI